ncbi:MAG: type II secretion system protein GspD [Acidobacteriota bacterium]
MKKIAAVCVCALIVLLSASGSAQTNRERRLMLNEYIAPDEIVSISQSLPFDKAMLVLSDVSRKYVKKIIVDDTGLKTAIGVDIQNMYWLQAMETILRANNCWYEEREEYFRVFTLQSQKVQLGADNKIVPLVADTSGRVVLRRRDVKISSWFFTLDVAKSLNYGINWNFFYAGDTTGTTRPVQFGGNLTGGLVDPSKITTTTGGSGSQQQGQDNNFIGRIVPSINFTNISALVSLFQGNNLGEVLSSPSVVVSSGKEGNILIGQKFYTTVKDFAGNTVQQEQSAGISIKVTPTVYEENGLKFINLDIAASRSTLGGSVGNQIINTSEVKTYSVLYDGEELVLGGLYNNTESNERGGIPILKDLPWWVFGLKYLFGYDKLTTSKQELIILLKAEVVPTIEERVASKAKEYENILQRQLDMNARDIESKRINKDK